MNSAPLVKGVAYDSHRAEVVQCLGDFWLLSQERKAAKHLWVHRTAPAADRGPTDKQLVEGPWEEAGMPKWSCCPHPSGFGVQTQESGLWEDTVQSHFQPFIGKPRLKGMVQNWVEAGLRPVTPYPGD